MEQQRLSPFIANGLIIGSEMTIRNLWPSRHQYSYYPEIIRNNVQSIRRVRLNQLKSNLQYPTS